MLFKEFLTLNENAKTNTCVKEIDAKVITDGNRRSIYVTPFEIDKYGINAFRDNTKIVTLAYIINKVHNKLWHIREPENLAIIFCNQS